MLGKRGAHQEHEATLQAKTEFMQMCAPSPAFCAPHPLLALDASPAPRAAGAWP
jgi:hypothetical protein